MPRGDRNDGSPRRVFALWTEAASLRGTDKQRSAQGIADALSRRLKEMRRAG
jgi:hypothetical protein